MEIIYLICNLCVRVYVSVVNLNLNILMFSIIILAYYINFFLLGYQFLVLFGKIKK